MFSGIVSDIGEVRAATRTKEGAHRLRLRPAMRLPAWRWGRPFVCMAFA